MKTLHLFDFDGTISHQDSMTDFIAFVVGTSKYYRGLLSQGFSLLRWKMGYLSSEEMKRRFLAYYFSGRTQKELEGWGNIYAKNRLPFILKKSALEKIQRLQKMEEQHICVVSASLDTWLRPFCEEWQLDLICTELAYDENQSFRGQLATPNCSGEEKARRIKARYQLNGFAEVITIGPPGW